MLRRYLDRFPVVLPGLTIAVVISIAATFLSGYYGVPLMLMALLLGMAVNFLSADPVCSPGFSFASGTVLRFGVALLGARITLDGILELGFAPVVAAVVCSLLTIAFGMIAARLLGLPRDFGILTGGATGICGASAALAISSVLERKSGSIERQTIFTIMVVTTLSTIAMVVYPILTTQLDMSEAAAGLFLGASIHDVAQVAGAGYGVSPAVGDAATLTKLMRVAMLVPIVLGLSLALLPAGARGAGAPRLPFFLVAFVVLAVLRNINVIPASVVGFLSDASQWMLVTAISALGVKTVLKDLAALGPRSLALLVLETLFVAGLALSIVLTFGL